jgi:Helix-turn-helix domain
MTKTTTPQGAVPTGLLADWLTEPQAAAELGKSPRTLRHWRLLGEGPPFARFGNEVRYKRDSIRAWADGRETVAAA